jgi:transcriptional antiterminator RfaH
MTVEAKEAGLPISLRGRGMSEHTVAQRLREGDDSAQRAPQPQWYAVKTKPNQDRQAQWHLRRLGVETFCPQIRQEKLIRRKRRLVTGSLFPGYLFARFDLDSRFRQVQYAHGVQTLVAFGQRPTPVEVEVIEAIRSTLQEGCLLVAPPSLKPGQIVRIQHGPFQGLEAVFEYRLSDQERVALLLRTLSYQARVVVELAHIVHSC